VLIDVAIPGDRNVINKEAEKILKYKDLTIEIQCMWNVKTRVIAVIIGASGTISKSFRKYVTNILGKRSSRAFLERSCEWILTFWRRNFVFLNLGHPVCKM
jgi:hypothetical protein